MPLCGALLAPQRPPASLALVQARAGTTHRTCDTSVCLGLMLGIRAYC